jgi:hypothetical protein
MKIILTVPMKILGASCYTQTKQSEKLNTLYMIPANDQTETQTLQNVRLEPINLFCIFSAAMKQIDD